MKPIIEACVVKTVQRSTGMKGRGKQEIPKKTHRTVASSDTIPTCENPEVSWLFKISGCWDSFRLAPNQRQERPRRISSLQRIASTIGCGLPGSLINGNNKGCGRAEG
ncbi:hypothetical protein PR048_002292 [Dryococelus australis]|uniref:Uncharacterized protein n=1 Tax=Dryococelus australis TaxID=614101 RepID=A0ABQ9IKV4_9NEOP|nr:hypothetical protein PR048_002292 [Dryococelus australis]